MPRVAVSAAGSMTKFCTARPRAAEGSRRFASVATTKILTAGFTATTMYLGMFISVPSDAITSSLIKRRKAVLASLT